ncbi:MAG: hypothetical protein HGA19_00020 [Oscillochloris sp.]|nr:hypothetical protein [Oscillochloris sp.]
MITTVTTTVTTITTATLATITLFAVLGFLALLIQKEILSSIPGALAQRISRALTVAIVPLTIVFLTAVAFQVYDILS